MKAKRSDRFVIVSSPLIHELAASVVAKVEKKYGVSLKHLKLEFERFANGEVLAHIPETVRRQHVFFFHPLQHPSPNDAVMTMLLVGDALKRASVDGITLVTPYMPYLRQDRKHKPRVPISARLLADLIESNARIERIITADMHADQEQGFFSIPVDNLTTTTLFADFFNKKLGKEMKNVVAVAPDFGGAVRTRRFAEKLGGVPVAIFEKRRPKTNHSEVVSLIGESVVRKTVLIFDDMIDTGGSIRNVVSALKSQGAKKVFVCATHGIFSGEAEKKFADAGLQVLCTNSIPRENSYVNAQSSWLKLVPMDDLLADAVFEASVMGGSISKLNH